MPCRVGRFLSIDLGSTSLTAAVIDTQRREALAIESAANTRETTSEADRNKGRSEWSLDGMVADAISLARKTVDRIRGRPRIDGIGVTGQQHGCQLLGVDRVPCGPFISWQDRRLTEPSNLSSAAPAYLDVVAELGGARRVGRDLLRFEKTGCLIGPKHTAALLFWILQNGDLPMSACAATAPDYLVHCLTGGVHVVDPTNAHGWGVYDVLGHEWNRELIASLGLPQSILPSCADAACIAGGLIAPIATDIGLTPGTPVAVASGDHQCSFAGSVANHTQSVAINIGTGGQMSVFIEEPMEGGSMELRPFIQGGYLLTAGGEVGGRTVRYLLGFLTQALNISSTRTRDSFSGKSDDMGVVFERIVAEADAAGEDAGGVRCVPLFDGSPGDSAASASFEGLTAINFTVGNLSRALLNGIARNLYEAYREAVLFGTGERKILVGSGNGLRLNSVLMQELSRWDGHMPVFGTFTEEAAVGAALCSAVAIGEFGTIQEASASLLGNKPLSE